MIENKSMKICHQSIKWGIVAVLILLGLSSCSQVYNLKSETGLYDVKLVHTLKSGVDGVWSWGKGNPYVDQKEGKIFIAELKVDLIKDKYPRGANFMVRRMRRYVSEAAQKALEESNAANQANWQLTENESEADIRVDMAIASFRPQKPLLRVASTVGGFFSPVPGVSSVATRYSQGDIGIEMTIRNVKDGRLLFACKDSNREMTALIEKEAYRKGGNADVNLRVWADRLGKLIRSCSPDHLGTRSIRDRAKERSWWDVITTRLTL